jgi:hypothetical protein
VPAARRQARLLRKAVTCWRTDGSLSKRKSAPIAKDQKSDAVFSLRDRILGTAIRFKAGTEVKRRAKS